MDELFPDWKLDSEIPIKQPVLDEEVHFFTKNSSFKVPNMFLPPDLHNSGNYIISLGQLCKYFGTKAEELGVDVLAGYAGSQLLMSEDKSHIKGVLTGDFGIARDGSRKDTYQAGMEIRAKLTVLAEGARGSLSQEAMGQFGLDSKCRPQTYGLGFKEVWEFEPHVLEEYGVGKVMHTVGHPADTMTYAGGFLYTMAPSQVHLGYIVGLDYHNPKTNLYNEFQLWKSHPKVRQLLEKGRCIRYGARVINEGGYHAVPDLVFPGGMLVGCSAGFVNILKIKGIMQIYRLHQWLALILKSC